jgi:hypothetical protein
MVERSNYEQTRNLSLIQMIGEVLADRLIFASIWWLKTWSIPSKYLGGHVSRFIGFPCQPAGNCPATTPVLRMLLVTKGVEQLRRQLSFSTYGPSIASTGGHDVRQQVFLHRWKMPWLSNLAITLIETARKSAVRLQSIESCYYSYWNRTKVSCSTPKQS